MLRATTLKLSGTGLVLGVCASTVDRMHMIDQISKSIIIFFIALLYIHLQNHHLYPNHLDQFFFIVSV